jgi:hypothetical protein
VDGGVKQGYGLSLMLFIIYKTLLSQNGINKTIQASPLTEEHMDTILFGVDQVLLATNEDDLQRSIYSLSKAAMLFTMEISTEKSKVMAFKCRNPTLSKICLNNKIIEQVNKFNIWATICPTKKKYIYKQQLQTL